MGTNKKIVSIVDEFNPKVRTVLISAYEVDNDPVFRGYVKEGVIDSFVQKPIAIRDLCQEVSYQDNSYQTKVRSK